MSASTSIKGLFLLWLLPLPLLAQEAITVLALFPNKAVVQVEGNNYTLTVGKGAKGGVELLAADSESATVSVGGERRTLKLGQQISSTFPAAAHKVVQIWPNSRGMYAVSGSINRHSVSLLVDTGASTIALNSNEATRLGIDYQKSGTRLLGETASGRVMMHQVKLEEVTVGSIRLSNVEAVVIEGAYPSSVLLGQSFLNRIEMQREGSLLKLLSLQ